MRLFYAAARLATLALQVSAEVCPEDVSLLQLSVAAHSEASNAGAAAPTKPLTLASLAQDARAASSTGVRTRGRGGGGDHDSIFFLKLGDGLLQRALWWIIVCMLVYTIIVDRAQALANYLARGDRCDEMFIQRVYAELQIFGLVAISLFICQNLFMRLPGEYFVLFEFVDILCSMGACSLIVVGVVLHYFRKKLERSWTPFRDLDDIHDKLRSNASSAHEFDQGFLDFYVMAAHFRLNNNVPTDFDFFLYMRESLSQCICFLININWITWFAMLGMSLVMTFFVYFSPTEGKAHFAVVWFAVSCWLVASCIFGIYLWLSRGMKQLREHIGSNPARVEECWRQCSTEVGEAPTSLTRVGMEDNPALFKRLHFDEKLAELLKRGEANHHDQTIAMNKAQGIGICSQMLQILSLISCFQLSLYVMTIAYNIKAEDMNSMWHLVTIAGFCASTFYLLPMAIAVLALIEGYAQPDPDVLDAVISESKAFERDCEYVKDQIRELTAKPELRKKLVDVLNASAGGVRDNKTNFQDLLQSLHINVGENRLHRLMQYLDEDRDGTITVDEFIRGVGATDIANAVKQGK